MAEPESQHLREMGDRQAGVQWGRLSSEHSAVLCQAVPVACLLFLQDFFSL